MSGYGSLEILKLMLENARRIDPWKADEFDMLNVSVSSVYRYLKQLVNAGLILSVRGGYVLSPLILEAGALYQLAFSSINKTTDQEKIYGKK